MNGADAQRQRCSNRSREAGTEPRHYVRKDERPMTMSLTPADIHPWVAEGVHRVRFGISIFPQPVDWRQYIEIVQRAEAGGMDGYWAYDHPQSRVDCWTSLSALAATTSSIRLGTAV